MVTSTTIAELLQLTVKKPLLAVAANHQLLRVIRLLPRGVDSSLQDLLDLKLGSPALLAEIRLRLDQRLLLPLHQRLTSHVPGSTRPLPLLSCMSTLTGASHLTPTEALRHDLLSLRQYLDDVTTDLLLQSRHEDLDLLRSIVLDASVN